MSLELMKRLEAANLAKEAWYTAPNGEESETTREVWINAMADIQRELKWESIMEESRA